ncbi:5-(carboxyamino)imidazole ribonucleotide synthase [Spiroplasma corruscae]|uniref:N5-carboxyaminoimidazole ribonucleotide synthase n=1 Tax=Spiroplasma corruscae TaxID=216934 RepID=A0A222EQ65_9MOLU|nr:ATP-grasp domain-containing protein [Spiroplasma corruscae]ASP28679.1 5-(carboxyamino)imidazole ribonucleotide synthase [Spiroplasma corruscae]
MRVGIIGGGQLARMLILSSPDTEFIVLEPKIDNSCSDLGVVILNYDYNDKEALRKLSSLVDVITYEFENIDDGVLNEFKSKIKPGIDFLKVSKNRFKEKVFAKDYGLKTLLFYPINSQDQIKDLIFYKKIDYPFILKVNSGGYDGKGQYIIKSKEDYLKIKYNVSYLLEEFFNFDYETSVLVTRSTLKQIYFFPTPINYHENGILKKSLVLAKKNLINSKLKKIIKKILIKENIIGTVAFEFFVKNKELYFNEMAPRVHNTGHYSLDGCNVSQFRNHILAITSRKIIKPKLLKKTIMYNLLGNEINTSFILNNVYRYDYKKKEPLQKRKMGHINISDNNKKNLIKKFNEIKKFLEEENV